MSRGSKGRGRSLAAALFLAIAMLIGSGAGAEQSAALPAPQGDVILTVTGKIGRSNGQNAAGHREARFDRAMLEQLGRTEIVTMTPWYKDVMRFEGVLLREVLAAVAAEGDSLHAVAHNDYAADLPVDDAKRYDVILAMKANGQVLTLRDKGPLFIIYPYSSDKALRTELISYRSVWQLRSLEVR